MKQPKIGEVLYVACDRQSRVGETIFLTSTQHNATKKLEGLREEVEKVLSEPDEEEWDDSSGTWVPVIDVVRKKDVMIFELRRIA